MRPDRSPDWDHVDWHYRFLHRQTAWHNRLVVRAKGLENVPRTGGFVYVGNHTSWWDPIAMAATVPRPVNFLGKKEVFKGRLGSWFFGRGGVIPVDRDGKNPEAYARAVEALRQGRVLGVFPEGRRYHGALGPAKTGAARMALEAGVPVLPSGIASDLFWPKGRSVPKLGQRIYVSIGEPVTLRGRHDSPADARAATDELMASVWKLLEEARAARDAKAPWPIP